MYNRLELVVFHSEGKQNNTLMSLVFVVVVYDDAFRFYRPKSFPGYIHFLACFEAFLISPAE